MKIKSQIRLFFLLAAFSVFQPIYSLVAVEEENHSYQLQEYEFDYAALRDLILSKLLEIEGSIIDDYGGHISNLPKQGTPHLGPTLQYKDDDTSADYSIIRKSEIKIFYGQYRAREGESPQRERIYFLNKLGIKLDIQSDEISAWCDNVYIKMKFDHGYLVIIELFPRINE